MSFVKKCLWCVGALVALLLLLVAASPALVSTSYGKNASLRMLASFYDGKVEVENLSVGWFSGVRIDGLRVQDPAGRPLLECAKIDLDKPLIKWLYSWKNFGNVTINSPSIFLPQPEVKEHKKHSKKSPAQPKQETTFVLPGIQGTVTIEHAKIVGPSTNHAPAVVSDGNVNISLDLEHSSSATVQANISQGDIPPTPLSLAFSMNGNPLEGGSASFSLLLDKVPTELVALVADGVEKQIGDISREALGSSFSYKLDGSMTQGKAVLSSHLKSENVCSDIDAVLEGDLLSLEQGAFLKGTLTPALFQALRPQINQKQISLLQNAAFELDNTTPFTFNIKKGDCQTPFHLTFGTKEPLVLHAENEKSPLILACSAELLGEPGNRQANILIKTNAPQQALARLNLTALPKNEGCDINASLIISGPWLKIGEQVLGLPIPSFVGEGIHAEAALQGTIVDPTNFSLQGSSSITTTTNNRVTATLLIKKNADSPLMHVQTDGSITLDPAQKDLCANLGNEIKLGLLAFVDPDNQTVNLSKLNIGSSTLSGEISNLTLENDRFMLSSPALFSFKPLNLPSELKDAFVKLAIAPFAYTVQGEHLVGKPLEYTVTAGCTFAHYPDPLSIIVPGQADFDRKIVKITPLLTLGNQELLKGTVVADLPNSTPHVTGDLLMKEVPISLLDMLSSQKASEVIGQKVSSTMSFEFTGLKTKGNRFSLQSQGDFWKMGADIRLDEGIVTAGNSGTFVDAALSPDLIKKIQTLLQNKNDLGFGKPIDLHASLSSFQLNLTSLLDKKEVAFASLFATMKLKAKVTVSDAEVLREGKPVAHIAPLSGELEIDGANQHVDFRLNSAQSDKAVSPEVAVSLKDFMDKNGPCFLNATVDANFKINSFPLQLTDIVAPGKGKLAEEMIGKTCSIQGSASIKKLLSGVIKADLNADHAKVHLDGAIKEGNFTLNSPAIASLELTREAGEVLLKGINPLLTSAAHSEKPITVTVDQKGVSIPLRTFSLNALTLPNVTIDVGKMVVKNGGALKVILALLKMGKAANSDELNVWLTPIYLHVNNGLVTCLRSDALVADQLHMITWGTADLVRDNLDMMIAIPLETLNKVGIQIASNHPERGLQIPIKGPSSNPKIETGRATAKLAGASATKVSSDKRVQLLGGLIQAAATVGEEDKPIPAQTTQPLPWERGR